MAVVHIRELYANLDSPYYRFGCTTSLAYLFSPTNSRHSRGIRMQGMIIPMQRDEVSKTVLFFYNVANINIMLDVNNYYSCPQEF